MGALCCCEAWPTPRWRRRCCGAADCGGDCAAAAWPWPSSPATGARRRRWAETSCAPRGRCVRRSWPRASDARPACGPCRCAWFFREARRGRPGSARPGAVSRPFLHPAVRDAFLLLSSLLLLVPASVREP